MTKWNRERWGMIVVSVRPTALTIAPRKPPPSETITAMLIRATISRLKVAKFFLVSCSGGGEPASTMKRELAGTEEASMNALAILFTSADAWAVATPRHI